jgi:hypothetical protein
MTVPVMIVLVWVLVFGVLHLPLTGTWGQFGFEPQTFSCTLGIHAHSGNTVLTWDFRLMFSEILPMNVGVKKAAVRLHLSCFILGTCSYVLSPLLVGTNAASVGKDAVSFSTEV